MDTTQAVLAILGTLITGVVGGGGVVWKFMVKQINEKDKQIGKLQADLATAHKAHRDETSRLNDDRVQIALSTQATAGQYNQVVTKLIELVRALKLTLDAQEDP